jgi:hypothetical protein
MGVLITVSSGPPIMVQKQAAAGLAANPNAMAISTILQ